MNKKRSLSLFFLFTIFITSQVRTHTNKTYLRPVDKKVYIPNQTFSEFIAQSFDDQKFRSKLDLTLFYFDSTKSSKIGRYFGANETNNITISTRNDCMDVYLAYLWHLGADPGNRVTNVLLNPKTTYFGGNFSFKQDLSFIIKKLYAEISIPFLQVKNDLRAKFCSKGYDEDEKDNLINCYLAGSYQEIDQTGGGLQSCLCSAKFKGKQTETGFGDLDFTLAYRFGNDDLKTAVAKLGFTAPIGNKLDGKFLFEPISGNGGHWAINLGCDGYFRVFDDGKVNLNFVFDLIYSYFFENSQKRILSIKGANWGQYYLLGKNNSPANTPLIPTANVLTRDVNVSPNSQFFGDCSLLLNVRKFNFGLGYSFLFKEEEKVKSKCSLPCQTYAVAVQDFDTSNNFPTNAVILNTSIDPGYNAFWLNNKNIDFEASQNPDIWVHKIYGELGYNCKCISSDLILGLNLGGAYNFVSQNSAFEGWSTWLKAQLLF